MWDRVDTLFADQRHRRTVQLQGAPARCGQAPDLHAGERVAFAVGVAEVLLGEGVVRPSCVVTVPLEAVGAVLEVSNSPLTRNWKDALTLVKVFEFKVLLQLSMLQPVAGVASSLSELVYSHSRPDPPPVATTQYSVDLERLNVALGVNA